MLRGKMEIEIFSNKRKIRLKVQKCNLFGMFRGLMFRRRENAPALLLFDFKKSLRIKIHSWFVFFPFLAVWLDDKNKIVEKRLVKPWKFLVLPRKKFMKLVEIPLNKKYIGVIGKLGVPRR